MAKKNKAKEATLEMSFVQFKLGEEPDALWLLYRLVLYLDLDVKSMEDYCETHFKQSDFRKLSTEQILKTLRTAINRRMEFMERINVYASSYDEKKMLAEMVDLNMKKTGGRHG
jgi:hypothetical protein